MTVYLRRDTGKYIVHFIYKHPDGRKEEIREGTPFTTRKQAEAFERQKRRELLEKDEQPNKPLEVPMFAKYAETFIETYAKVENKPSEVTKKQMILRKHLKPFFGKLYLDRITKQDIKAYRSKKLQMGYARKTVNNHLAVLSKLLTEAEEEGLILHFPRVRQLKTPPSSYDFLTVEEANALIDAAKAEWRTMILLALRTGLRQGELLGLQWKDINLELGFLSVERAIYRGRIGSPKSNKGRTVPLSNEAVNALIAHKHRKSPFVFCRKNGDPLTDGKCKHPLRRACDAAELRKIGWHTLRHTFASHLVQAGVSILKVKEYLGHSDIRITMRYAHLNPEIDRNSVQLLDTYSTYTARNVIKFRKSLESLG